MGNDLARLGVRANEVPVHPDGKGGPRAPLHAPVTCLEGFRCYTPVDPPAAAGALLEDLEHRSEERRVGKECRL